MNLKDKEWLPHLENSIPIEAQGYKVSSYAVALEGWRRGLTVKYIDRDRNPLKIRYSLSDGTKEHIFAGSRGDLVTKKAIRICIKKDLTKKYLMKANVPTPEGESFSQDVSDEQIINYAEELGYPLVIKPVAGSGGKGVIANIKSKSDFITSLSYVRNELNFPNVIVEKFFPGTDYRVYVIGDEVIAAFDRIPANVIGDGKRTIKELLDYKIQERQKNPALYNRPITIDGEVHTVLKSKGYSLDTVPKNGERVFLKTKNNVSSGGDSRDVTDELTDNIRNIAINAVKAVPGLVQAGLDIIVDKEKGTGVVLEINARPSIRNHLFPMVGKARDIPKAIVDYYFPETQRIDSGFNEILFYFDLKSIHQTFRNGIAKEFVLPKMPTGDLRVLCLEISGEFNSANLANWISKHTRKMQIHGFTKYSEENILTTVIAGNRDNITEFKRQLLVDTPSKIKIKDIIEGKWNKPVKVGFEIKKVKNRKVDKVSKTLKRSINNNNDYYKKEYYKIKNSTSWKITKPLRVLGRLIKKITK